MKVPKEILSDRAKHLGVKMVDDDDILAEAAKPCRVGALEEAIRLTSGERNADYGDPVANHQHIADIFNAITGKYLSARDIAIVHQATKMARRQHSPTHRDSYVDGAAYTAIEYECALAETRPSDFNEVSNQMLAQKKTPPEGGES